MGTIEVLFDACRNGDIEVLKHLMAGNADINVQDNRGYTPLIIQRPVRGCELLEANADVDAQDFGGNTALMGACFKGYPEIAELLIEHGASLDIQHGNGGTALMFATMFGRNELVKIILNHGADKRRKEDPTVCKVLNGHARRPFS